MFELWIVIAVLSLAMVTLGFYALGLNRRLQAHTSAQEQQLSKFKQELNAINSAAVGVGQRLISAEKKLNAALEQHETTASTAPGFEPYLQAANYADRGVTAQELAERFGLSEAEAHLMSLVKNQRLATESASY